MLRGRVSQRHKPFVCALCRYRSATQAARGQGRLLSGTPKRCDNGASSPPVTETRPNPGLGKSTITTGSNANLPNGAKQGGWGKPAFAGVGARPGSNTARQGASDSAPALDDFELAARRRLAPVSQAPIQKPARSGVAGRPAVAAKFVWNEKLQSVIEGNAFRNAGVQKIGPRSQWSAKPENSFGLDPRSNALTHSAPFGISRDGNPTAHGNIRRPRSKQAADGGSSASDLGSPKRISWRSPESSDLEVRSPTKANLAPPVNRVWGAPFGEQQGRAIDKTSSEATEKPGEALSGSELWGSLARKRNPGNTERFWAEFGEAATDVGKKASEAEGSDTQARVGFSAPPNGSKEPAADATTSLLAFERLEASARQDGAQRKRESITTPDIKESALIFENQFLGDWDRKQNDHLNRTEAAVAEAEPEYLYSRDRKPRKQSDKQDRKRRSSQQNRYDDEGDDFDYDELVERKRQRAERKAQKQQEKELKHMGPIPILLPELITVLNLASAMKIDKQLFLAQLNELGFEDISMESLLAGDTAALIAQEYGYEPTVESGTSRDLLPRPPAEDPSALPPRPPVVTIMGHVDHGKTTLLDFLRKSSVAAQEHGGITQHIGAFSVQLSTGKQITFLDTPGHAAFLTMRQRGANVTDIVVLVVAADDSVKPQTLEALKHARDSKVPIIVAISKADKEGARIDQVKNDLSRQSVEIEDFGGDVQVVSVSGKTGLGMAELEENIVTLSEILDFRAEDDGPVEGWVLESTLKPIGRAATILVKRGTMRPGDFIVAGTTWAKIRSLRNEAGVDIAEAGPGTPVEVLGWRGLPAAGDMVLQAPDGGKAADACAYRAGLKDREKNATEGEKIRHQRQNLAEQREMEKAIKAEEEQGNAKSRRKKRTYGTWGTEEVPVMMDTVAGQKRVNFIVKGDVHGSVEAVCATILEIGSNEVVPRLLRSSAGHITESDIHHAAASDSVIVNFNLPIAGNMKALAEESGVRILDHNVIYHLADDVKSVLSGYLDDEISFKVLGEAEVLQVFPINTKGREFKNIAGCRVRNGKIEKTDIIRVFRRGEKIFEGSAESFKHGKKDVTEARKGGECGLGFEMFQDLEVGDQIQAVEKIVTSRTL